MISPEKLINEINDKCSFLFINSRFELKLQRNSCLRYNIEGTSDALNRFGYPEEYVRVIRWFNNFWLYVEINFLGYKISKKNTDTIFQTCISLSVFHGDDNDIKKNQLFRAEWDDFNNPNENHSQPHWHITSDQAIERAFDRYHDLDNEEFLEILTEERNNVIDVKRMHFAMNGNWGNANNHIHKIESEDQIVNWFLGLLTHLRTELED